MAYRFDAVDDKVEFAISPFSGYAFGAITIAAFVNRNSVVANRALVGFTASNGTTARIQLLPRSDATLRYAIGGIGGANSSQTLTAGNWFLIAMTRAAGSGLPRYHVHDGTSWSHADAPSGAAGDIAAIVGTDRLFVGTSGAADKLDSDLVCIGIKTANSSDAAIETLSRTSWAAWVAFGFDWLIGFDSSLESAGILQDQASPGTGDEIAITGTSAVSDPAGWSFALAATPVADFSATPLSGTASLSVAFTDSSTNTPTSWAWTFGDGGTSSSQNPTHSYTVAGTYSVQLTATNAAGSDVELKTGYVTVSETIAYAAGGGIDIY